MSAVAVLDFVARPSQFTPITCCPLRHRGQRFPTAASCCAASRSNVRHRIHFGLTPSPFKMLALTSVAPDVSARPVLGAPACSRRRQRGSLAAPDRWANEPVTRAAQTARRSLKANGVVRPSISLTTALLANQGHALILGLHLRRCHRRHCASIACCPSSPAKVSLRAPSAARTGAVISVVDFAPNRQRFPGGPLSHSAWFPSTPKWRNRGAGSPAATFRAAQITLTRSRRSFPAHWVWFWSSRETRTAPTRSRRRCNSLASARSWLFLF